MVHINGPAWARYTRRPHYAPLAQHGRLTVVESPLVLFSRDVLRAPLASLRGYWQYARRARRDGRSGATVVRPLLMFPARFRSGSRLARRLDRGLKQRALKASRQENGHGVHLLTSLHQGWLIEAMQDGATYLLDMNDDWSLAGEPAPARRSLLEDDIRSLAKEVDIFTAVTRALIGKYGDARPWSRWLPNCVDTTHYVPAFETETKRVDEPAVDLPPAYLAGGARTARGYGADLSMLGRKTGPFVASISGMNGMWSDYRFMAEVERLAPAAWQFVSSGTLSAPARADLREDYERYVAGRRTHFMGYLDYRVLPDFLERVNVGIVTYRMSELNRFAAPNKIWAYLAMGLPVVSIAFAGEEDQALYEGLVAFCKTPEEFVAAIARALEEDSLELKKRRRALAERYSAVNRARAMAELAEEFIRSGEPRRHEGAKV